MLVDVVQSRVDGSQVHVQVPWLGPRYT